MSGIRYSLISTACRSILSQKTIFHSSKNYKLLSAARKCSTATDISSNDNTSNIKDDITINSSLSATKSNRKRFKDLTEGPDLADFILGNLETSKNREVKSSKHPYLKNSYGPPQKVYFEIYGCQMNVNDTEVVWAILKNAGYIRTKEITEANIILIMTCAIRDSAEEKIWSKLGYYNDIKVKRRHLASPEQVKIGVLGCMAERLKNKILDRAKYVDLIAGPDSYRDLPRLLSIVENHETAINVALSFEETYADVTPVRLHSDSISAFVSIMRGCDNMCTYCIVPFTRGRERSRPVASILDEVRHLSDEGIKEVTLLGQNVNSYRDLSESQFYVGDNGKSETKLAKGFKTVYKSKLGGMRFSDLLDKVSLIDPEMRIRFTSPHPKDFPDEVLELIASRPNICKQIHLPAQSGNSEVLERMRRGYTRESYLELVEHIRDVVPDIKLSSDFIAGFCGETDEQFEDTISLIKAVQYHNAFLFRYSMREKTTAHRRFKDDVPENVKLERVAKMTSLFRSQAEKLNRMQVGTHQLVLIEGPSRKNKAVLQGRTDGNTRVLIPDPAIPGNIKTDIPRPINPGDYVVAQICGSNSNSLTGIPLYHSSIVEYRYNMHHTTYHQDGEYENLKIQS